MDFVPPELTHRRGARETIGWGEQHGGNMAVLHHVLIPIETESGSRQCWLDLERGLVRTKGRKTISPPRTFRHKDTSKV